MRVRALVTLVTLAAGLATAGKKSDIDWKYQYDLAADRAKAESKPLLIDFWAAWCGPCREMERESWADSKVIELSRRFVAVSINLDRDRETGERFFVSTLPTVILASPWGETLNRREGFVHPQELAGLMADVPADFGPALEAHQALKENPKDPHALAQMGLFFVRANAYSLANRFYEQALKTKECKANPALSCDLSLAVGLNTVFMGDANGGRKLLAQFLKDYPGSSHRDRALFGLVVANLRRGKRGEAETVLAEMKEKYPMSGQTAAAEKLLAGSH